MTNEQYESLRRYILDLKVEVQELKLMLKKQNEVADHRHNLMYAWCAPADYQQALESDLSGPGQTLDEFLSKLPR